MTDKEKRLILAALATLVEVLSLGTLLLISLFSLVREVYISLNSENVWSLAVVKAILLVLFITMFFIVRKMRNGQDK